MKNLTAIYWIKDESRYIPEYIEFHLLQGFDHFILYDNKSTDDLLNVVSPYIESGILEIRYYPEDLKGSKNFWLMDHCIVEQRGKTKWLHYHAIDERLYCPNGGRVVDLLPEYENYGGLCVGWEFFNSNGHITRPEGLIIDNFTQSAKDPNCHIKTIIQPDKAIKTIGTPHNFYFQNTNAVDENFNIVSGNFNPKNYSMNKIKLNHYVTLSREEFDIKMNKGILDHAQENQRRRDSEISWNHHEHLQSSENKYLSEKYSEIVKKNILDRYKNKEHLLTLINV